MTHFTRHALSLESHRSNAMDSLPLRCYPSSRLSCYDEMTAVYIVQMFFFSQMQNSKTIHFSLHRW